MLNGIAYEVIDELQIISLIQINAGFTVAAGVTSIGARAYVAGIHWRVDGQISSAASAADSLSPTVPSALNAASASIKRIERQADPNVDVLIGVAAVQNVYLTIGDIWPTCRDDVALCRLDSGSTNQAVGK